MKAEYKIVIYLSLIIITFMNNTLIPLSILSIIGFTLACIFALQSLKRSAKFICIILVFTFLSNLLFQNGKVLFYFAGVYITQEGLVHASVLTARIFILITGAQILNATTSSEDLIGGITRLMGPAARLKPVHDLLAATELTLKILPSILKEVKDISTHSGTIEKGFWQRLKYTASLIVDFLVKRLKEGRQG